MDYVLAPLGALILLAVVVGIFANALRTVRGIRWRAARRRAGLDPWVDWRAGGHAQEPGRQTGEKEHPDSCTGEGTQDWSSHE
jgi:hypothetical protein